MSRVDVDGEQQPYMTQIFWAGLTGVVYLPSTAVPLGAGRSKLPIGMQVVSDFLEDRTALRFSALIEEITGGFERPPEISSVSREKS